MATSTAPKSNGKPGFAKLLVSQCLSVMRILPGWPVIPAWLRMKRNHPATLAKTPCSILTHHKKLLPGPRRIRWQRGANTPCSYPRSLAKRAGTSGAPIQRVHKACCTKEKGLKKWSGRTEAIYFLGRSNCVQMISLVELSSFFLSLLRNVKGWTA